MDLIFLVIVFFCILQPETVYADKTVDTGKSGSVTIRYFDDVDERTPVAGAEFTFYKIDDSSDLRTYTDTTNQDGILKISEIQTFLPFFADFSSENFAISKKYLTFAFVIIKHISNGVRKYHR